MAGADYIANPPSPPLALRPTAFPASANTAAWVSAAVSASSRDGSVNDVCSERLATESLQQGSGKALRVCERRHPEDIRQASVAPFREKFHPLLEVLDPAT